MVVNSERSVMYQNMAREITIITSIIFWYITGSIRIHFYLANPLLYFAHRIAATNLNQSLCHNCQYLHWFIEIHTSMEVIQTSKLLLLKSSHLSEIIFFGISDHTSISRYKHSNGTSLDNQENVK
ncbi:hypothetical protein GOBAR_DD21927 [Gossypium barbadense]|nr:hypothetical protein GOBAR_DD21927 [Gossypium barbadense]